MFISQCFKCSTLHFQQFLYLKKLLSYTLTGLLTGGFVFGAEASGESAGVSAYAYEIGRIFNLPLTNAILTTWVVCIAAYFGAIYSWKADFGSQ